MGQGSDKHGTIATFLTLWLGDEEGDLVKNFDPSNNWHEYDIRWTPNHITFIIDGVERRREVHTEDDPHAAVQDLDKKQHIIMNFWTPDWCAEALDSNAA